MTSGSMPTKYGFGCWAWITIMGASTARASTTPATADNWSRSFFVPCLSTRITQPKCSRDVLTAIAIASEIPTTTTGTDSQGCELHSWMNELTVFVNSSGVNITKSLRYFERRGYGSGSRRPPFRGILAPSFGGLYDALNCTSGLLDGCVSEPPKSDAKLRRIAFVHLTLL